MLPVTTSTSTPNRGATTTTTPQSAPNRNNRKTLPPQKIIADSRDLLKAGDRSRRLTSPRPTSKTPTSKGAFVNEPIARSIAGYVVNNIPNKLQTFKWIRTTKKESV